MTDQKPQGRELGRGLSALLGDDAVKKPQIIPADQRGQSNEVREKLTQARPTTLGAAVRMSGITPAAITILLRHVRRRDRPAA